LKKVVVVVGDEHKEMFTGENLEVLEHPSIKEIQPTSLEVKDGDVTLASFLNWTYWRQIE